MSSSNVRDPESVETVVIGGGQAGLSVGYHLRRLDKRFAILEARPRVGDVWRERWDSLRLFTPARFSGLDGMRFPAPAHSFPTKDDMADYLEAYTARFDLPVRTNTRVERLSRSDGHYLIETGAQRLVADNVVVAMSDYQRPKTPAFARELDPAIIQIHSFDYRNPAQLRDGPVLIVGAGNSGAEIARELAPRHDVWVSGRSTGQVPFRIDGLPARLILVPLLFKGIFHRVLTVRTPIGRTVRPKILHKGGPLIRVKARDLDRVGVRRVPRTTGVADGAPVLEDGRRLEVANVVWCTGFHPGFDWIDLPVFTDGEPAHRSGIVPECPGLYFVGLFFLHALSSAMIHGVGRDAERAARAIARSPARGAPGAAEPLPVGGSVRRGEVLGHGARGAERTAPRGSP